MLALAAACSGESPADAPGRVDEPGAERPDAVEVRAGSRGTGVALEGRVVGGEAEEPVEGAYVVVLGPDVTLSEWEDASGPESEALMEAATVTDERGTYAISDLPRGRDYTLIVAAKGYVPAVFDHGLAIRDEDPPVVRPETVRLDPRPR